MHSFVMDKSCFYRGFLARKLLQAPTVENANAEYWVIDYKGEVQGGCGFYPAKGLPDKCVEIVKYPDPFRFSVVPAVVMTISTEKNEKGEKNGKIEKTENFNSPVINNLV